jgi:hypothetical protein
MTFLAPEQYAKLNVVGQWLHIPDVIALYYEDQINQAVGRNRRFRDNAATETIIIASYRLYKNIIEKVDTNGGSADNILEVALDSLQRLTAQQTHRRHAHPRA